MSKHFDKRVFEVGKYGENNTYVERLIANGRIPEQQSPGYPVFVVYYSKGKINGKHSLAWFVQESDAQEYAEFKNKEISQNG